MNHDAGLACILLFHTTLGEPMCLSIFLLADSPISVPPDKDVYPGLLLRPVEAEYQSQTLAGIQRIDSAPHIYSVSPAGYCGCYFGYETPQEFQSQMAERAAEPEAKYANTAEEADVMWRSRRDAVQSFGRYVADHPEVRFTLYAVWEHNEGQKEPVRAEVPPSYFDGLGFERLPEDVLLTVVPESHLDDDQQWEPDEVRSHDWLSESYCCWDEEDLDASS